MSISQNFAHYQTKYNCQVQNVILLSFYKDYKVIKKLRGQFWFSELYDFWKKKFSN